VRSGLHRHGAVPVVGSLMRTTLNLLCVAVLPGLVASTACGSKAGAAVDGGITGPDTEPNAITDGRVIGTGSDGGARDSAPMDASSTISPDAPFSGERGADGGGRDGSGIDRVYLPLHSPDGSIPDCIWTLLRQCCGAPGDRCTEEWWDGGVDETQCWPTGERETFSDTTGTLLAYSSDGTLCFTSMPKPGGSNSFAFYNGAGQEVATYSYLNDGSGQVQISCDGATYRATPPLECSTVLGQRGRCLLGNCPR
jgi:hypothetical protein